jgi:hypothetical protein
VTAPNFSSMEATHHTNLVSMNFSSSPILMPASERMTEAEPKPLDTKLSHARIRRVGGKLNIVKLIIKPRMIVP